MPWNMERLPLFAFSSIYVGRILILFLSFVFLSNISNSFSLIWLLPLEKKHILYSRLRLALLFLLFFSLSFRPTTTLFFINHRCDRIFFLEGWKELLSLQFNLSVPYLPHMICYHLVNTLFLFITFFHFFLSFLLWTNASSKFPHGMETNSFSTVLAAIGRCWPMEPGFRSDIIRHHVTPKNRSSYLGFYCRQLMSFAPHSCRHRS